MRAKIFIAALCAFLAQRATAQDATSPKPSCPASIEIDCTPHQDCSPPHDTRECNACLISLLGTCRLRGNDPSCEAAKAAQNTMYATQKSQCEVQKASQKAACEATREALKTAATACQSSQQP